MGDESGRNLLATMFQAHPWHGVSALTEPNSDVVNAFIEIVPSDTVKYELDKASGHLRIDRPQLFSSICPMPYGFVPQTYCGRLVAERCAERTGSRNVAGDADPIDICVLTEKVISHSSIFVSARLIGGLRMIDGAEADDKMIAVLRSDLAYGDLGDISECPQAVLERLKHYFLTYKQKPDDPHTDVRIAEVYDGAEALEVIRRSMADYRELFGVPEEREAALPNARSPG